jgi:hypothetical protein
MRLRVSWSRIHGSGFGRADPLAHLFVDVDKAKKDLDAFALANDARVYKLFKACVDPQSDLRTIVKSRVSLAGYGKRFRQPLVRFMGSDVDVDVSSTSSCAVSSNRTTTSSTPFPSSLTTRRGMWSTTRPSRL